MAEFLAIFFMAVIAVAAIAAAINFFWNSGPWRALGYASFMVAIFLIFWASGLWRDATRHSWGALTPVFALMIIAGGALVFIARAIWRRHGKNNKR